MKRLIIYASRGISAQRVAQAINENFINKFQIICVNNEEIDAQMLEFEHLILVCPTYGDEELETGMERFLINSNWNKHKSKKFSVCELGLYRGYEDVTQGAGRIICEFLKSKGLIMTTKLLSVDSIPLEDFSLINKWCNNLK